jgi:hypothetical protein
MTDAKKNPQVGRIDALYALPLTEFTPARNALAKELRRAGTREAADEAASARKPSVAAWAVNQLVRSERKSIEQLLALGRKLREAQAALVAGGDADAVISLSARERELVQELVDKAAGILMEGGGRASEATLDEVRETLHAAVLDEDSAAAVASGRLTTERRSIGLGLGTAVSGSRRAASRREARPPARVTNAERRLAEAHADARKALEAAERELRRAEREASQAARAAELAAERERRAAEALERARGRA